MVARNPEDNGIGYEVDTEVILTATINDGWEFTGWIGDGIDGFNMNMSLSVIMNADRLYSATFQPEPEGEGEPQEGEIVEGEGEQPIPLSIEVTLPVDGATVTLGGSIFVQCYVDGPNQVEVTLVSPEGDVYRQTVTPPVMVGHHFDTTLVGSGLVSFRVTDTVTNEVVESTRSVTVRPVEK